MQSLEELSLLNCFPPDVLEKYGLKIIEKFDNTFLTTNYQRIIEIIESKISLYTAIVVNQDRDTTTVIKHLRDTDLAEVLLYTLEGFIEGELDDNTLYAMIKYIGKNVDIDIGSRRVFTTTDPIVKQIIDDFKKTLTEGTNIDRLVGCEFLFDNRNKGRQIEIKIMKTQKDFDYFLEYEHEDSSIEIASDKKSIRRALRGWWHGRNDMIS